MIKGWSDSFSPKFYLGLFMIIASFALGALVKVVFLVYIFDSFLRWISIILYIVSWVMLGVGVWWAGKESYEGIRRYMTYRYYHESLKEGTKKAYHKSKVVGGHVKKRLEEEKAKVREKAMKNKLYIERRFGNRKNES